MRDITRGRAGSLLEETKKRQKDKASSMTRVELPQKPLSPNVYKKENLKILEDEIAELRSKLDEKRKKLLELNAEVDLDVDAESYFDELADEPFGLESARSPTRGASPKVVSPRMIIGDEKSISKKRKTKAPIPTQLQDSPTKAVEVPKSPPAGEGGSEAESVAVVAESEVDSLISAIVEEVKSEEALRESSSAEELESSPKKAEEDKDVDKRDEHAETPSQQQEQQQEQHQQHGPAALSTATMAVVSPLKKRDSTELSFTKGAVPKLSDSDKGTQHQQQLLQHQQQQQKKKRRRKKKRSSSAGKNRRKKMQGGDEDKSMGLRLQPDSSPPLSPSGEHRLSTSLSTSPTSPTSSGRQHPTKPAQLVRKPPSIHRSRRSQTLDTIELQSSDLLSGHHHSSSPTSATHIDMCLSVRAPNSLMYIFAKAEPSVDMYFQHFIRVI